MEIPEVRLKQLNLTKDQFNKISKEVESKVEENGITEDLNDYITKRINEENKVIVNFFA